MKNSPKSILMGWTALAGCTVVGYILSKKYTEGRIRDYTEGSGSITSSQHYHARQSNRSDKAETEDGKGLRRSVERSL